MAVKLRKYKSEKDFKLIMDFLKNTYDETRTVNNWLPSQFENHYDDYINDILIWEDGETGRIIGVANPDCNCNYYLQIHPLYTNLDEKFILELEDYCIGKCKKNPQIDEMSIISVESERRDKLLEEKGYTKSKNRVYVRFRSSDFPIIHKELPAGYKIRNVNPETDYNRLAAAIRKVFGHGEWFQANILEGIAACSFYKKDLDLIIEAPNGDIAAFCTFRLDPRSEFSELEPLATLPEHRNKGLAEILLNEGFKRVSRYNPKGFFIGSAANTPGANRLYDKVGYLEKYKIFEWTKKFPLNS